MAEIKITATNFETEVLHSDKPVLVDMVLLQVTSPVSVLPKTMPTFSRAL